MVEFVYTRRNFTILFVYTYFSLWLNLHVCSMFTLINGVSYCSESYELQSRFIVYKLKVKI